MPPRHVVTALVEHRSRQAIVPLTGLIFTTETGTPLGSRNVTRYLVRLELPHQGFHSLRHAFATLMVESGEDLGTVSRILGTRISPPRPTSTPTSRAAMLDRSAERMDAILGG